MHKTAKVTVITACVAALTVALITGVATRTSAQGPGTGGGPANSLANRVAKLTAEVSSLQTDYNTLASTVTTLQTDVSKLDGNITAADLVGTYQLVQIQNELAPLVTGRGAEIGAYVYTGTGTLKNNGTGSFTNYTQTGSYLIVNQASLQSADVPAQSATFDWTYANGVITLSNASSADLNGQTLVVGAGGRVLTKASSNLVGINGNDSLIVATRLQ